MLSVGGLKTKGCSAHMYQGGSSCLLAKDRSATCVTASVEAMTKAPGPLAMVTAGQAMRHGMIPHE